MAILQTRELKKYYGAGDTLVKALDGVELSVENGEFVAIIGTSGSGKSTLLHMLGGLDRPTSGTVTVDGRELSTLKDEELTIFRRRKIGFVFQAYNLVPVLSVYENSRTSQDVLGLMKVTGQKFAQTMVMITHNEEIAQLADRIVRIEDGRIVTR